MDAVLLDDSSLDAGGEEEPMPQRHVTNYDLALMLGKLQESSEESKKQRNDIQLELREAVSRIAILTAALGQISGDDGKLAQIEKRVAKLETVADILEKGRQRGLGILAGLPLAAGVAGATLSQGVHDLLGKLLALLRGQ